MLISFVANKKQGEGTYPLIYKKQIFNMDELKLFARKDEEPVGRDGFWH